jgi:hypothetical protein
MIGLKPVQSLFASDEKLKNMRAIAPWFYVYTMVVPALRQEKLAAKFGLWHVKDTM